ncbi:CSON011389 protein [Gryllus bimaculatus]|nr:CSON011389 protein [Gryllus bimaculatus]
MSHMQRLAVQNEFGYQHTLMYGRYTRDLGEFAKEEARRVRALERRRRRDDRLRNKELQAKARGPCAQRVAAAAACVWRHTFARLGEDWVFLALLGVIMALLSFFMDRGISMCNKARLWLYNDLATHPVAKYMAWISLPVCLILFSAGFGPFVHIASIAATLLSKLVTSFQGIYENESRNCEMLAAACAVGVASCFAAPIGGVLFSIEVTTVYFAVRNYWRGFFAAVCGATVFRLLAVWFQKEATVTAVFGTNFTLDFPFDPQELIVFALIGAISGLGGAFYVWMHRQYVLFMRRNKKMTTFLQKNRFLYPGIVSLIVATVSFPLFLGQYMAGIWSIHKFYVDQRRLNSGRSRNSQSLVNNAYRCLCQFSWFHNFQRGYATVGAAAFSGAVTHTISVSVIVFEMTGQITHIIPIMIAVLISNAIASFLQPSLYDSIILIKKLPYLPDLLPSSSGMYSVYVEDFMVRDVKYIWHGMNYKELKEVLKQNRNLKGFPLVDSPESMILLGSIQRLELIKLIERHIGRERRMQVAAKWQKEAQERAREEMERKMREESQKNRRPSRFEVVPAPDILKLQQRSTNELSPKLKDTITPGVGSQPKKSILKKTYSFTTRSFSPLVSPNMTPYTTVTGAESRIRLAFEAIFRKSATLQDVNPDQGSNGDVDATDGETLNQSADVPTSPRASKKVQLPHERVIDMSPEDQKHWEEEEMGKSITFDKCHIDPAPFQLVEKTSLLKVHSLFSMVGVNHAYVTTIGRLIGVVGLKELRKAIEDANAGNLPAHPPQNTPVTGNALPTSDPRSNSTVTSMDSALSSNTAASESDAEEHVQLKR